MKAFKKPREVPSTDTLEGMSVKELKAIAVILLSFCHVLFALGFVILCVVDLNMLCMYCVYIVYIV